MIYKFRGVSVHHGEKDMMRFKALGAWSRLVADRLKRSSRKQHRALTFRTTRSPVAHFLQRLHLWKAPPKALVAPCARAQHSST